MTLLDHDARPPMLRLATEEHGRAGAFALRTDLCEWPDSLRGQIAVVEAPSSSLIVPLFDDGTTVLIRQWRYAWAATSWEVPAGTLEEGEEPLACARRELVEEAGIQAQQWVSLGHVRPMAYGMQTQHLFLARDLTRVERAPEESERDMVVRELPLRGALDAALNGEIVHSASVAALGRAARAAGVI